jgi:hypothetical protein
MRSIMRSSFLLFGTLLAATMLGVACTPEGLVELEGDSSEALSVDNPAGKGAPGSNAEGPTHGLAPHDVSIGLPLVQKTIGSKTMGHFGELLPTRHVARMLQLLTARTFDEEQNPSGAPEELVATAIRIDPCFGPPDVNVHGKCDPQVRIVFQPVYMRDGSPLAGDAGVHVFYAVSSSQLDALVREIARAKGDAKYWKDPFGVHPLLARDGMDGAFGTALAEAVLKLVGDRRIIRITGYEHQHQEIPTNGPNVHDMESTWRFAQMKMVRATPPGETSETTGTEGTGSAEESGEHRGGASGHDTGTEGWCWLGDNETRVPDSLFMLNQVSETLAVRATRIENPTKHTPDTVDCGSCHIAEATRKQFEHFAPTAVKAEAFVFGAASPKATTTERSYSNIHAFSYFGRTFTANQRTANETAVIVNALNTRLGL